jgi:Luciferase-like monooxygenase
MLEAYTTLGAPATATERVQLSTLVTGNTYRLPTHLAKAVTALDVVSGGRAVLGIGAGWFELEHRQLGFEFGTFTDRFERLDEALQIIAPMLRGERPTVEGKWYRTENAMNEPRIRDSLPIVLGGGGARKTFGLAARRIPLRGKMRAHDRGRPPADGARRRTGNDLPRPYQPSDRAHGRIASWHSAVLAGQRGHAERSTDQRNAAGHRR